VEVTDMAHTHARDVDRQDKTVVTDETHETDDAYEKFGGANTGAAFFGWLVVVGVAVLLTGILGAAAAAIGDAQDITQSDADRQAGTIGIAAAIALVAVLMIGNYAGGYVAGRMSRFDGARQGILVWVIGLVVTVVAVAVGLIFGDQYDVFDRVDLPSVAISDEKLTWGGAFTGLIILVGTLLAAVAGGTVGRHYHARVDKYAARTAVD
jgi:amino acid transporter